MPTYVDGFVIPVPKKRLPAYLGMAKKASKIWKEYGALDYKECVGDDLDSEFCMPFPKGIKTKPGETVLSHDVSDNAHDPDRTGKARVLYRPLTAEKLTKYPAREGDDLVIRGDRKIRCVADTRRFAKLAAFCTWANADTCLSAFVHFGCCRQFELLSAAFDKNI